MPYLMSTRVYAPDGWGAMTTPLGLPGLVFEYLIADESRIEKGVTLNHLRNHIDRRFSHLYKSNPIDDRRFYRLIEEMQKEGNLIIR